MDPYQFPLTCDITTINVHPNVEAAVWCVLGALVAAIAQVCYNLYKKDWKP